MAVRPNAAAQTVNARPTVTGELKAAKPVESSVVAIVTASTLSRARIPTVPPGDIAGVAGRPLGSLARLVGRVMEMTDETARQWSAACIALLVIALALGATLAAGP